ncbi:MAG: carbohydrate ABC transporter permease [Acidimicrobiales bacterium]
MSEVGDTALLEREPSPKKSSPSRPPKVAAGPGLFGARRRNKSRLIIAIILSVTSLGPLLYMVSLSFQPNGGLLGATVLIPTHPTVQNYVQAWTENSFSRYFVNSLIVAIATVVITVVLASLAAFAFARYQFPLKQTIFYFFLASLAVPNLLLLIPQFLLMDRLHLLDSLTGLVLLYVASNLPFTIFLLRGFFEAIPKEYEESFRLDGARTLGVLTRLIVPLALPAIAVVSMFIFSASWDEFPVALTMIQTSSHYTLPVGLADFIGVHTVAWGPFFAASVIATLPVIAVFLISLRWFRSGVSLGAIR